MNHREIRKAEYKKLLFIYLERKKTCTHKNLIPSHTNLKSKRVDPTMATQQTLAGETLASSQWSPGGSQSSDASFSDLYGLGDLALEFSVEIRRWVLEVDRRIGKASQVVIDGDCAAKEQDLQPDRRGKRAMVGRVIRRGRDSLAENRDRRVVIKVID